MRGMVRLAGIGLLGATLLVALVAPARAQQAGQWADIAAVPPQEDAYASQRPLAPPGWDKVVEHNLGMGALLINTVFFPLKLVIGLVGAEVGGLAGAMSGGDIEAAAGVWNVTTDGSYFVTPADLDGRGTVRWTGDDR